VVAPTFDDAASLEDITLDDVTTLYARQHDRSFDRGVRRTLRHPAS
jgi:hypothetical protein